MISWNAMIAVAISYSGSDAGNIAKAKLQSALRELDQLRDLHVPIAITPDEMADAWFDTHDREGQDETLEALNAILANRAKQEAPRE